MSDEVPAVAGGTPVRSRSLAFARAEIGPEEEAAVVEVLRSGWFATGPRTTELECGFEALVGVRCAVATNPWTAGMHLLLRALGVGPGDEDPAVAERADRAAAMARTDALRRSSSTSSPRCSASGSRRSMSQGQP